MTARPIRSIAVTGATGFIGGAIVRSLLQRGYQVRVLVRPASIGKPLPDGVERVVGTLRDPSSIERLLHSADAAIHCAGAVRGAERSTFVESNATAVELLVQIATQEKQLDRLLLLSSLAAAHPGVSPYAESKRSGELALQRGCGDLAWLALRSPAVYGPGDRELLPLFKAISRGLAPLWGNPNARFSLLFIDDLVDAVEQWLASEKPACGIYELHDGRSDGYTMDDVIETVARMTHRRVFRMRVPRLLLDYVAIANLRLARLVGYEPMLTPWKLAELRHPRWVCDNGDFSAVSGWEPRTLLAQGLPLAMAENPGLE